MPLNGNRLGTGFASFKSAYEAHKQRVTPTDLSTPVSQSVIDSSLKQLYNDLGDNVVGEFTSNAVVPQGITVQVAYPAGSGATTGAGSLT